MNAVLSPSVQTSGQVEPDLFGDAPAANQPSVRAEVSLTFTGTLRERAHVATRMCDGEGHMVPVLVFEIEGCGAGHQTVRVEVPYTEATRRDAENRARRMRKGDPLTVTSALSDIRVCLPNAEFFPDPQP